jgi:hypothetical protein
MIDDPKPIPLPGTNRDRLLIDVQNQMSRFDNFVDSAFATASSRQQFLENPLGTLKTAGLVDIDSEGQIQSSNRLLYSIVTNQDVLNIVREHSPKISVEQVIAALRDPTPHAVTNMLAGYQVDALFQDESALRNLIPAVLNVANSEKFFTPPLTEQQITGFTNKVLGAVSLGGPLPTLGNTPVSRDAWTDTDIAVSTDTIAISDVFAISEVSLAVDVFVAAEAFVVADGPIDQIGLTERTELANQLEQQYASNPKAFQENLTAAQLLFFSAQAANFITSIGSQSYYGK